MNLFISPHQDDAVLFGAFTLMREHPLVLSVTDAWMQYNRGTGITADLRWNEEVKAMALLKCPVIRCGIRDDIIDEWFVRKELSKYTGFEKVYVPALQGGHTDHDIISKVATEIFPACIHYTTYSKTDLYTTGKEEVIPSAEELALKEQALMCYESQFSLPATRPHFESVKGRSEWYI